MVKKVCSVSFVSQYITHTAGKTLEVVEPKLQIGAGDFNTWYIDNNMGVHYGKTHAFVVGSKHMTSADESISIPINKHSIESVNTHKHLGITIDKNLTWEQQNDLVCQNFNRKPTLLKLSSKYVNQNCLKQHYNSYVLPVFDFGCVVWGNTTNANLTRLVQLQKRAARMRLNADFITPSEQLFKELNWLPFPKRVHTCLTLKYIKAFPDKLPNKYLSLFTYVSDHHERQARSTTFDLLHVPRSHSTNLTGHFQYKVQYYGIAYQRTVETAHLSIGLKRAEALFALQ